MPPDSRALHVGPALGVQLLRDAWECARELNHDPWQLALDIATLTAAGLSQTDLRWLITRGYSEHGEELTQPTNPHRRFRIIKSLALTARTCFTLTEPGYHFAAEYAQTPLSPVLLSPTVAYGSALNNSNNIVTAIPQPLTPNPHSLPIRQPSTASPVPFWDDRIQELRLGDHIVKRFTHPARAQTLILAAFQEEGWPPSIDDPLPTQYNQDPKRRLHYTIQNLNRFQKPPRIHFFINGNGQSIRWEIKFPKPRPKRASHAPRARKRR